MSMAAILGNLQIVPTRWAFTRHLYNLPLLTVQCSFSVRSLHMAALGRHHTWWRSIMSDAQMAVLNTSCQSSCRSRRRHIGVHCLAFGNPCSANRAVRAFHTRSHTLSGKTNTIPSDGPHRHVQVNKHLVPSDAQRETIYAVATPPGKGGVAVIRISGPHASHVYFRMVRPFPRKSKGKGKEGIEAVLKPRKMVRCTVVDPLNGDELDDGLAVFFNSPHSFTTEDVLELHIHSGRAILAAVLNALARLSDVDTHSNLPPLLLRPAERGEFTRRAFLGGRLDLTQAEALRDLIDAETEVQRRVALRAARGSARERFEKIRHEIINAMAMTEALIDFGEGEDIEEGVYDHARMLIKQVRDEIAGHLADDRRGEIMRSGLRLAIFGPPNAGKSSLLNFLAGREAAIVTPIPGTTRDVVELTLDMGGLAVVIADTAGLRTTDDAIEQIGIERARQRIDTSDVSLCVLSIPDVIAPDSGVQITDSIKRHILPSTFVLFNKSDICDSKDLTGLIEAVPPCAGAWVVSLSTGEGLDRFVTEFGNTLRNGYGPIDGEEEPLITNVRHRTHLKAALSFLDACLATDDIVIAAEELRYAANAAGKVTGAIDVEEVLDVIFREFCIGK